MKDTSYRTLALPRDKIPNALAGKKLCDVRPAELQQFVNDYAAGGASESYTQKMCSLIRSAMDEAVDNDLVAKNPARKLKTPHKQEKPRHGYTAAPRYTHPSMDALQDASNAYLEIMAHA